MRGVDALEATEDEEGSVDGKYGLEYRMKERRVKCKLDSERKGKER